MTLKKIPYHFKLKHYNTQLYISPHLLKLNQTKPNRNQWDGVSDTSYYCNNFNDKSRAHVKNLVSHLSTVNPRKKTKMFLRSCILHSVGTPTSSTNALETKRIPIDPSVVNCFFLKLVFIYPKATETFWLNCWIFSLQPH